PSENNSVRTNGVHPCRSPLSVIFSHDVSNLKPAKFWQTSMQSAPSRTSKRSPKKAQFLTRDTMNTAFDPAERLEAQDMMIMKLKKDISETDLHRNELEDMKT